MPLGSVGGEEDHRSRFQVDCVIHVPLLRICPGIQFGEAALFIAIASVLHQLDIQPKCDEQGRSTIPSAEHVQMKDSFLT